MATITASLFCALDGVVDPGVGNWHFPYFNEEMGEAVGRTHDADVMLFGRVTYDSFAGAWPDREAAGGEDAAFAKQLGDMRKIVASRNARSSSPGATPSSCRAISSRPSPRSRTTRRSGGSPSAGRCRSCGSCSTPACSTSCICSSTRRPPGRGCGCSTRERPSAPHADLVAAVPNGRGAPRVRAGPEPADGLVRGGEGDASRRVTVS